MSLPVWNIEKISLFGSSLYVKTSTAGGLLWTEAQEISTQIGGDLVTINNEAENIWLNQNGFTGWIGLTDVAQQGEWKWISGEEATYINWFEGDPSNFPGEDYVNNTSLGWGDSNNEGFGNFFDYNSRYGITEVPLTLSIDFAADIRENSSLFTTSINLSAGSETSGNLAEGSTVYWKISGITADDLDTGTLNGSGVITNGKLELQHSLVDDGVEENESFEVSVYSDAQMQYQIGNTSAMQIQEDQEPIVSTKLIRGNSFYTLVDGPSWNQAESQSLLLGGHLATVNDSAEDQWIFSQFGNLAIQRAIANGYGGSKVGLWIGLNDEINENNFVWSSGQQVDYTNWAGPQEPQGGYEDEDYAGIFVNWADISRWGDFVSDFRFADENIGVAEIPILSSITLRQPITERGGVFTTSINLSAGTETSGNLIEGLTVYWKISGITADDLESGDLTGSGVITNGKLDIQHALLDDGIAENETFEVSVFSDAEMQYQIGDSSGQIVQDGSDLVLSYKGKEYLLTPEYGTFNSLKDILIDDPWWFANQDTANSVFGPDELAPKLSVEVGDWFNVENDITYAGYNSQKIVSILTAYVKETDESSTTGALWDTGSGFAVGDRIDNNKNHFFLNATLIGSDGSFQLDESDRLITIDSVNPPSTIGSATSNASQIVISGDLTSPLVEAVSATTTGKGKNKITVSTLSEVPIDQAGPLDALTVTGGDGNNTITGQGFADDPNTGSVNESRSAFSGVLVIDGKGGADSITGGTSGPNWLIGGGVSTDGTVDTLTGVSVAADVFDLRKEVAGAYEDAYSIGHAVINKFELGDTIVLSGSQSDYAISKQSNTVEIKNKRGKVIGTQTTTFFEIKDQSGDLLATVNGSEFTGSTTVGNLKIVYGQATQSPFEVILPGSNGGTII